MRLSLRLMLSLIAGVTAVSLVFVTYQTEVGAKALRDEVQRQALVLAESQQRSIEPLLQSGDYSELQAIVDQLQDHERLAGAAVFDLNGRPIAITAGLSSQLAAAPQAV